jgi:tetrahydromethanopterin S-methyltransferase subunit A
MDIQINKKVAQFLTALFILSAAFGFLIIVILHNTRIGIERVVKNRLSNPDILFKIEFPNDLFLIKKRLKNL